MLHMRRDLRLSKSCPGPHPLPDKAGTHIASSTGALGPQPGPTPTASPGPATAGCLGAVSACQWRHRQRHPSPGTKTKQMPRRRPTLPHPCCYISCQPRPLSSEFMRFVKHKLTSKPAWSPRGLPESKGPKKPPPAKSRQPGGLPSAWCCTT